MLENARSTQEDVPPKKPQAAKVLLERKEFCYQASISLSTLKRLEANGELETRRVGRKVLIPSHQLDRLARTPRVRTRHVA